MGGTAPFVVSPDPKTPMFYAQKTRQYRSLVARFERSSNWLLPGDLRSLAGLLLEEADRREQAQQQSVDGTEKVKQAV